MQSGKNHTAKGLVPLSRMAIKHSSAVIAAGILVAVALVGCSGGTSTSVNAGTTKSPAPTITTTPIPTNTFKAGAQTFTGSGTMAMADINVPVQSTLTYSCPNCGKVSLSISGGLKGGIVETGLYDETTARPIPIGARNIINVRVITKGGSWTLTITPNS